MQRGYIYLFRETTIYEIHMHLLSGKSLLLLMDSLRKNSPVLFFVLEASFFHSECHLPLLLLPLPLCLPDRLLLLLLRLLPKLLLDDDGGVVVG